MSDRAPLPAPQLELIRRTRRHPRRTQTDYLILRVLADRLRAKLAALDGPLGEVLDLYAATQPYRDLLPPHERYVAMDIDEHYGPQDVVSGDFLPFEDSRFDLILFTEAFHYLEDPRRGVAELERVLQPGGWLVMTVPLVWEYDRRITERRYSGPELGELFAGWEGVEVSENGGYAVAWATLSGRILRGLGEFGPPAWRRAVAPLIAPAAWLVNAFAALLARAERRWHTGPFVLPMGLMVVARKARRP